MIKRWILDESAAVAATAQLRVIAALALLFVCLLSSHINKRSREARGQAEEKLRIGRGDRGWILKLSSAGDLAPH